MSLLAFAQQKPPFVPRPAVSFFLNEKNADARKNITKSDTLLEVKALLQGEQKQKMPDMKFLISEVEISLVRNDKKIAGLVISDGKGSLAPLSMLAQAGDKYQFTVRGIKFLSNDVYIDVGAGDVIKNYTFE